MNLKKRDKKNIRKKVLIFGMPGHGKSTFAHEYCKEHGLNPIVLDIDDTNFTGDDIVDINLSNDLKAYNNIKITIKEIKQYGKYDTIIVDGVGSLLELLVSSAKGQKRFLDRSDRFNSIFEKLNNSDLNLIFIGQEDMNLENYIDTTPNKSIIKVNAIVNEIYYCQRDGDNFTQKVEKYRKELEDDEVDKKSSSTSSSKREKKSEPVKDKPKKQQQETMDDLKIDVIAGDELEKIVERIKKVGLAVKLSNIEKRANNIIKDEQLLERVLKEAKRVYGD